MTKLKNKGWKGKKKLLLTFVRVSYKNFAEFEKTWLWNKFLPLFLAKTKPEWLFPCQVHGKIPLRYSQVGCAKQLFQGLVLDSVEKPIFCRRKLYSGAIWFNLISWRMEFNYREQFNFILSVEKWNLFKWRKFQFNLI